MLGTALLMAYYLSGIFLTWALSFEWDPIKATSNLQKHGVSFVEAATVFFDPLSLTIPDAVHSIDEQRFAITGLSYQHRLLVVVHADRGDRIRIISVRL